MKQITPEIKAKIFSLYIGSDLCVPNKPKEALWPFDQNEGALKLCGVVDTLIVVHRIAEQKYDVFNQTSIAVRGLSSITDEDAIEVAKLASSWEDDDRLLDPIDVPEWISEVLGGNCATYADYVSGYDASSLVDLLRSKGYALPAFGYSVDELVEAGVFRLQS